LTKILPVWSFILLWAGKKNNQNAQGGGEKGHTEKKKIILQKKGESGVEKSLGCKKSQGGLLAKGGVLYKTDLRHKMMLPCKALWGGKMGSWKKIVGGKKSLEVRQGNIKETKRLEKKCPRSGVNKCSSKAENTEKKKNKAQVVPNFFENVGGGEWGARRSIKPKKGFLRGGLKQISVLM